MVGANGSGKTTLLESLLFVSGAIGRKGKVGEGNMVGDSSTEARERGMSVEVNAATIEHDGGILTFSTARLDRVRAGGARRAVRRRCRRGGGRAALERMITISPLLRSSTRTTSRT